MKTAKGFIRSTSSGKASYRFECADCKGSCNAAYHSYPADISTDEWIAFYGFPSFVECVDCGAELKTPKNYKPDATVSAEITRRAMDQIYKKRTERGNR